MKLSSPRFLFLCCWMKFLLSSSNIDGSKQAVQRNVECLSALPDWSTRLCLFLLLPGILCSDWLPNMSLIFSVSLCVLFRRLHYTWLRTAHVSSVFFFFSFWWGKEDEKNQKKRECVLFSGEKWWTASSSQLLWENIGKWAVRVNGYNECAAGFLE